MEVRMSEVVGRFRMGRTALLALALVALALPGAAGASTPTITEAGAGYADGTMSAAATEAQQGALTLAADDRAKARANAAAAAGSGSAEDFEALVPTASRSWQGVFDTASAPGDSTGAVGTSRYIELINRKFAIYRKTSNPPISTGTLNTLFGQSSGANSFDPQVIWDPGTRRFYYAGDTVRSASDNVLSLGWSTTATPSNGTTDWCHYEVSYGANLPDYPKLGDSAHFALIGVNTFNSSNVFIGSDIMGISKPPAGTTCPAASSLTFGIKQNIPSSFTPVAVNQTDSSGIGWFVARDLGLPSTVLRLWKVTRNATTGAPVFPASSVDVTVPSYTAPADAQQKSPSAKLLDTLDSRPTQAVSGADPSPSAVNDAPGAIWTQHTTAGGVGAETRWYEIDPIATGGLPALVQSGKVTSPSVYNFNAAISPNRAVHGATKTGGNAMVMGYSASGTGLFPQVRMVSKIGAAAQSAPVGIKGSTGNYIGFDCAGADNFCRWGDYAAATPEPNPPSAAGRVWFTNSYASGVAATTQANWRTWNWAAAP
jgi:hypothetical protein